jgi:predicted DsbA family dithiol-disulfide isomerase
LDIDQTMANLKQVASGLGLPFGDRKMTYNSRLAQELGKWAESKGKGHEFHNAAFRAYFADGRNIGKADVLVKVAESVDLSGKDARKVIQDRTYREAVDSDWRRSRELRITAVPTFLFDHQFLVGAQKYEDLEKLLLSNKVNKRTSDNNTH